MDEQGRELLAYNLACALALQGKAELAVEQLDICVNSGELPPEWHDDEDLAPIRGTAAFRAWLEKHSFDDPRSNP